MNPSIPVDELLQQMVANTGENLFDMTYESPVLLVFLRHFGCMFCREALNDISRQREMIEDTGARIVFVHMADNPTADKYFQRYNLTGSTHISDPECRYYAAFGLTKGTFTQLFGLQVWLRGFQGPVLEGYGLGSQLGDGFQMPGIFVIQEGVIKEQFIHKLSSDRPDYIALSKCCAVN